MSITCTCGRRMWCRDSRPVEGGTHRRYGCDCGARLETMETIVSIKGQPPIVSKDYERGLADGMEKMLEQLREFARKAARR